MKRDSVSAYVHMSHEISSPCTQLHGFWMTPSPDQLRTNLSDYVEGTLELRLEVNILLKLVADIFQKLFFNFEHVFKLINDNYRREFCYHVLHIGEIC